MNSLYQFGMANVVASTASIGRFQFSGWVDDSRSDLFSMGAVLSAICTGRPPFPSEILDTLLKQVCVDVPLPISRLNSNIPRWMSDFVNRLLKKSPADHDQKAAKMSALFQKHSALPNALQPVIVIKFPLSLILRYVLVLPIASLALLGEWLRLLGGMPSHARNKGKGDRHQIYDDSVAEAAEFG